MQPNETYDTQEYMYKHLTQYYRFEKSNKKNWWDITNQISEKELKLLKYLKDISMLRIFQLKTMVLQKREVRNGKFSLRLGMSGRGDQYWIGYFKDSIDGAFLIITHRSKSYIELFISEEVKDNSYTLMQLFLSNELNEDIYQWRIKHTVIAD